ncbi:MAG: acetyl-CoA acetyltransferase [Bacillota bacterium]
MGSIKDKVTIIGMGCARFGERWDASAEDLILEAVNEAYADAGIEQKDIQAAWVGTTGSGRTGQCLAEPLKLYYTPITRVENACATGSDAFRNACYAVAAGIYDLVLVVGFEKLKDSGFSGLEIRNPYGTNRTQTLTAPSEFALLATSYFAEYGLTPEEGKLMLARISAKSHKNGALNPKAHFQVEVPLDTILKAPIVAWPLGLFDCCGVSDGAAAAIVCRSDMARSFREDPIYVKALQICVGNRSGFLRNDYNFTHVEETYRAGMAAYQEAGITDPRREISLAEVHDCFSITEAVTMEDLQFSPRGRVKEDVEAGFFDLTGDLPVNPDGGLKCFGHPIGASGLRMLYEVYKQLQGKAGPRQIKNPRLGLTHNLGGYPAGPTISVIIVGN